MHPNIPGLIRFPVFALLLVFAFIVLGLDAYFVNQANKASSVGLFGFNIPTGITAPTFARLGVATSVLTIASLIPISVIDLLRKGASTSFVVVDLAWLGFLWVLWLATAADTASLDACSKYSSSFCSKYRAAEAISFLAWLLLMGYWIVLLVHTIIAVNNGQSRIWFTSVIEADFTAIGGGGVAGGVPHGGAAFPAQPQQQQQQQQQMMTGPATGPATYPPV